jgi:hypothetical protein
MDTIAFVKLLHLSGLIMGLGGAMLADFTTLSRGILRPVSAYTIHQMAFLSRIVTIGLGLLWISGVAIILINTQANPEYITNQKIWAKVAIVTMLTLNGFYIHRYVLPLLEDAMGHRLFDYASKHDLLIMTLCACLSFVSWTMAFVLARASALNYVTPMQHILAVYAVLLVLAWCGMYAAARAIALAQVYARNATAGDMSGARNRRIFDNVSRRHLVKLTLIASLLLFVWVMMFAIAIGYSANSLPPALQIFEIYVACLLVATAVMFALLRVGSRMWRLADRVIMKFAALTQLPNASWEAPETHGDRR